ncbi:hypothetical protein [Altererythrobacter sp. Root672]|uniref:hypothetical protein n=1 Tax=Altererythrobacter sp. Root672 TaxID=1736584 RepID=UPI0006F327F6|nr:hypothetical protein [Altererythrobacter sp. Root672]KRA84432.1 hypothetical protein ASD76_10780 [Altererythrobacter sp. Root672]
MRKAADRATDALVDTIAIEMCPAASVADRAVVCHYVRETVEVMPDYLRVGFRWLAVLFDWWSVPLRGTRFHRLDHPGRQAQVAAWRESRVGFRRSMIAFYTTFTAFGLYSQVQDDGDVETDKVAA